MKLKFDLTLATILGFLFIFVSLARAAHDLWAATLVYAAVLLMAVSVLVHRLYVTAQPIRIQMWGPLGGVLLASICSFIGAHNRGDALLRLMDIGAIILLFMISLNVLNNSQTIQRFVFVAATVFFLEMPIHVVQTFKMGLIDKPYGTLINANISALFHLMWIPVLWTYCRQSRWIAAAFGMAIMSLLLTRSTIGILCALICLPAMMGLDRVKKLREKTPRIFDGIILISVILAIALLSLKAFELISGHVIGLQGVQYTSRFIWWISGWNMFLDYPWAGIGLGNYTSAYLAYKVGEGFHTLYAHSSIVTILAEMGLAGLFTLVLFVTCWLRLFLRAHDRNDKKNFFVSVMVGMMFTFVNIGFEYLGLLMLFAVLMAICVAGHSDSLWRPSGIFGICLLGMLISASPYAISPFMASQRTAVGLQELKQNNNKSAQELFLAATELNSLASEPYFGLAETHHRLFLQTKSEQERDKALSSIRKAIDLNPYSGYLWWTLSCYLFDAGQTDEASQARVKAHELRYRPASRNERDQN